MAHFAKLNKQINSDGTYTVLQVFPGNDNSDENEISLRTGDLYKKCSYNTRGGVHYEPNSNTPSQDQSKAFRKNAAGIGSKYDSIRDAFIDPKPYSSWVLNETTCVWEPPITRPKSDTNGVPDRYHWNEDTLSYTKEVLYRAPEAN